MVTHGNFSVNRHCDTIPRLSNYSTNYFLHFSDDKCNKIHDTLKVSTLNLARRSIQSPSPVKSSYPSQTQNHYYYAIYNSCKFGIFHISVIFGLFLRPAETIAEQCFSKHICYKCKSAWLINYMNYYDSHLHLPFQLQLLQDVS